MIDRIKKLFKKHKPEQEIKTDCDASDETNVLLRKMFVLDIRKYIIFKVLSDESNMNEDEKQKHIEKFINYITELEEYVQKQRFIKH